MIDEIIIDVVSGAESKSLVINEIRVAGNKAWGGGYVLQRFRTTKSKVLEALGIQDVPDINVGNKWIPCSEQEPPHRGNYLVTIANSHEATILYYTKVEAAWVDEFYNYYKVKAWQPLPEPYKEGET